MKNKFCFSKTLAYLVFFVAVAVGFFLVVNYTNQQKLALNSQAKVIDEPGDGAGGSDTGSGSNTGGSKKSNGPKPGGLDCKQAGRKYANGAAGDWYNKSEAWLEKHWAPNYMINVVDVTWKVDPYYKRNVGSRKCFAMLKLQKKQSCSQVADKWSGNGKTCFAIKENRFYYEAYPLSSQLSDYSSHKNQECCFKHHKQKGTEME